MFEILDRENDQVFMTSVLEKAVGFLSSLLHKEMNRMDKQKRWQFYLIVAVILLTIYNILPTIIYYSKPLNQPIDKARANEVAVEIIDRVNSLEEDAKAWLASFCKLLGIKPESIELKASDPRLIELSFKNPRDAQVFRRFLPNAGSLIPFVPAQLKLRSDIANENMNHVFVERNIGVHLDPKESDQIFQYTSLFTDNHEVDPFYRDLVYDRVQQIGLGFAGTSPAALQMTAAVQNTKDSRYDDLVISLAKEIVDVTKTLGSNNPLTKRYYASFTQTNSANKSELINKFAARLETVKSKLEDEFKALNAEDQKLKEQGALLDVARAQTMSLLDKQLTTLETASSIIKKNSSAFAAGKAALTQKDLLSMLSQSAKTINPEDNVQIVDFSGYNPFIKSLAINWVDGFLQLQLYDDVQALRDNQGASEAAALAKEKANQLVINEIARISRLSDENITPSGDDFRIVLNKLTDSHSLLALKLGVLAAKETQQISDKLQSGWITKHADLERGAYPIRSYDAFQKEKAEEKKLGLVIYSPAIYASEAPEGFRTNSIYVIARGLDSILQKYREIPNAEESQTLVNDFNLLQSLLQQNGFIGYPGSSFGVSSEFSKDYIFELSDYYQDLLSATREDFSVKGNKRYAVLEFTDVAQRILARNKIDDRIQEDLLKWREEYHAAQVDLNVTSRYTVPPPTENAYWENFKLSLVKYFRGDDRKVLKWGLDLSGGKTVRIGLRDHNNRPVTNPDDLKQAVNELYTRINNMGVAERTIRIEGDTIILDFPGSQAFSAAELVKASAMYFHIVNEKFTPQNQEIGSTVNKFLQEVWNEAVVTNRKDVESINEIAWQHLGGEESGLEDSIHPRSESARILYDSGLRLTNPKTTPINSGFNDTISAIAVLRGDDASEWHGQSHPLMVIFHNYALEGASLDNVHVGYDPSEGNILMFGVKSSYEGKDKSRGNPRDDFYTWTSQFSEEKITGTPKEAYTNGRGWRMAVILNGKIISSPMLRAALRDSATISGRFSQREINQLAADLKAGSLSFTPRILSEQNVSPELGKEERIKGITASTISVIFVVVAMVGYYHFAGVVASCAVLFNLLIMWGVLQCIGAALTLPSIAGIVLTIGMAVDANVLVFERFREEFAISGRIGSAIQTAYRKAFSAIIDSNITTLMAALILIQFDSGPIKGFAVTLIIGIISSMFTALFMTRYFFAGWVQNPEHKTLSMKQFIGKTNFDFLKQTKAAVIISLILMLVGSYLLISQRNTIFGMDFTGGYSLTVNLQEKPETDYRLTAYNALIAAGATSGDIQVRELSHPNQLRLQLGNSMEENGHPFYQLPQEYTERSFGYDYERNPRIVWVVNALASAGLHIQTNDLADLNKNWSVMSGQLSDTMRNNAFIAVSLALIGILIYITIRFEFKFAMAAVIGLAHDVVITLGIAAVFHKLGFPVQIDLQVVGAILTIIGYSLNDTIIVFDRIREDIKILRKLKFEDIINHALNVTLSRTIMTSGTTMLVLLSLVLFGGTSLFGFSLVMTIGVVVGTFSSLFIASPVLLYLHNREVHQLQAEGARS